MAGGWFVLKPLSLASPPSHGDISWGLGVRTSVEECGRGPTLLPPRALESEGDRVAIPALNPWSRLECGCFLPTPAPLSKQGPPFKTVTTTIRTFHALVPPSWSEAGLTLAAPAGEWSSLGTWLSPQASVVQGVGPWHGGR